MEEEIREQADKDALIRYLEMLVLSAVTVAYLYLVQAAILRLFSLSATYEDMFALAGVCGLASLWWMLFSVRAEPTASGRVPWPMAGGLGSPLILLLDRLRVLVHLRKSRRAAARSLRIPAR
jgi:hypothetical protein